MLEVLEATPEGLDWVGSVPQDTVLADQVDTWCAPVRRSVIMEEMVWAVSAAGLTAAELDSPENELASVAFEGIDPCEDYYYYWW